jgi:hypothetical protein
MCLISCRYLKKKKSNKSRLNKFNDFFKNHGLVFFANVSYKLPLHIPHAEYFNVFVAIVSVLSIRSFLMDIRPKLNRTLSFINTF